ncbi:MAG: DUF3606 domain-containing protein [Candidatus Nanopelagicales bacterium]
MTDETTPDEDGWAKQFDVTREQIRDAIRAVGPKKADVEMYLKGSHSSTDSEVTKRAGG